MPFAAVTNVNLEGRERAQAEGFLQEFLVPRIKGLSGFRTARFLRSSDGNTGVGAVIFDTEVQAKAGLDAVATDRPPQAPPVVSTAIYEVIMEV